MNILKNMEAIFISATIIAGATSFAQADAPKAVTVAAPAVVAKAALATEGKMAVVTVSAKRLTAEEKARTL
jgi:hypothetical protein